MKLDRVTVTGADDSIDSEALLGLSQEFPFVEWGILVSARQCGGNRFPSPKWIERLIKNPRPDLMQLSVHICGHWVREILAGRDTIMFDSWLTQFQRIQLNFHREVVPFDQATCADLLTQYGKDVICQLDGEKGSNYMHGIAEEGFANVYSLFDVSGGAGIVPAEWPKPIYLQNDGEFSYHGYAGGLGPETLETELPRIAEAAGDCRIWIDMETRVRSEDDSQFDLAKVRRCLEICQPWIS